MIDSLITANGSMEECQDKVVTKGFAQQEGADLDETLTPVVRGFSQEEGVVLDGLILVLDFSINEFVLILGFFEFSAHFNLLFDRFDTLFLALYTDEFIIVENAE
jgi:hypothetical protein